MDVEEYIRSECDRQHVTNYDDFKEAWKFCRQVSRVYFNGSFSLFVQEIAAIVEPEVNQFPSPARFGSRNGNNLRRSEVGFLHGGNAAKAMDVPRLFERWCFQAEENLTGNEDLFIKNLLDIHPWADGNGRTASLLRNWMLGTLEDPEPLPYYYGKPDRKAMDVHEYILSVADRNGVEITNTELTEDGTMPDFYVRNRYGQCFELDSLEEMLGHFLGENGYRCSFHVGDNIVWLWRKNVVPSLP
jgi:hypothetical protein